MVKSPGCSHRGSGLSLEVAQEAHKHPNSSPRGSNALSSPVLHHHQQAHTRSTDLQAGKNINKHKVKNLKVAMNSPL